VVTRHSAHRRGDNLFLSSILALDPDTGGSGALPDHARRELDYTATQHIILAELPVDGKTRKVLMQAPKNGFFYVLDRATASCCRPTSSRRSRGPATST